MKAEKVKKTAWGGVIEWKDYDVPDNIRHFNSAGKATIIWLWQSQVHYQSALTLRAVSEKEKNGFMTFGVSLLLVGYAIETLLKMVEVAKSGDSLAYDEFVTSAHELHPVTHNLNELAATTKIRVSKRDRELLTELEDYILWKGKYPIPLYAEKYLSLGFPEAFLAYGKGEAFELKWERVASLYKKVYAQATKRIFEG